MKWYLLLIAIFSQTLQARVQPRNCPNNFKDIEKLALKYEKTASKLWSTDSAQYQLYSDASRALKGVLGHLGMGSRDDLGESLFVSYVVLNEDELVKVQSYIEKIKNHHKESILADELNMVLKTTAEKIPTLNLLQLDFDSKKLNCLGGSTYLNYLEHLVFEETTGIEEVEIENYKINSDKKWIQEIESLVKDEEVLWGDTILEGEIGQNGPAEAKSVSVVNYKGQRLLTKVFIQAPAVFTGNDDCEFSETENKWVGEGCGSGNIYVTKHLDLDNQSIGSMDFAEFD